MEKASGEDWEFQKLPAAKKIQLIQGKLDQYGSPFSSEAGFKQLSVRLLHPELLWPNFETSKVGKLISLTPDISYNRKRFRGLVVQLFTKAPTDVPVNAWFGIGAVEITRDDQIVIDCSRVETAKGIAQAMLPHNAFFSKSF